jgi:hypothetical protein
MRCTFQLARSISSAPGSKRIDDNERDFNEIFRHRTFWGSFSRRRENSIGGLEGKKMSKQDRWVTVGVFVGLIAVVLIMVLLFFLR